MEGSNAIAILGHPYISDKYRHFTVETGKTAYTFATQCTRRGLTGCDLDLHSTEAHYSKPGGKLTLRVHFQWKLGSHNDKIWPVGE